MLCNKGVIDFAITPAAHSQAWKSQKDKIAVKSSAIFNSHYIYSAFDPTLNELDGMMRLVPLEFAFTSPSCCYITDVEILKRAGSINIEDMRLIQLMHPEYQINNKLVGKKVLANAEMCNEVTEKQHGSRKHYQAGFLVLEKILVSDMFRYTHQSRCYGMNDAKGCFDWIQHTFAVLVLMYYGVAWSVATTLFQVLQQARHKIKTG